MCNSTLRKVLVFLFASLVQLWTGGAILKAQNFVITPYDSACQGEQITIRMLGLGLSSTSQVNVLYNWAPIPVDSIDPLSNEVYLTAIHNPGINFQIIVEVILGPGPNQTHVMGNPYKIKAPATVSYGSWYYCQQSGYSPPPAVLNGPVTFSLLPPLITTIDNNTGALNLATTNTGQQDIRWEQDGCPLISGVESVQIGAPLATVLQYPDSIECFGLGNFVQPNQPSIPSGTFSSSPNTLAINPVSGVINVDSSAVGQYWVYYDPYDPCKQVDSFPFEVRAFPDPFFSYTDSTFCTGSPNPLPDTVMSPGGVFYGGIYPNQYIFPAVVNTNSGEIDLQASYNPQYPFYFITYEVGSICADHYTRQISIESVSPQFNIDQQVCLASGGWVDATQITAPGTFYIDGPTPDTIPNLPIHQSSVPVLDLNTIAPGAYIVRYVLDTSNGDCPGIFMDTVQVDGGGGTTISYTPMEACELTDSVFPDNGPFGFADRIYAEGGLVYDPATGVLLPRQSGAGNYPLFQVINSGGCTDTAFIDTFRVTTAPLAQFEYPGNGIICTSGGNQMPTVFPAGGTFASLSGLPVNANTGEIELNGFSPQSARSFHQLRYTPHPDSCYGPIAITVEIRDFKADFYYPKDSVCRGENIFLLDTASTFSAGPFPSEFIYTNPSQGFLALNSYQGNILPQNSLAGTYQVAWVVNDTVCQDTFLANQSLVVYESPDPSFTYPGPFCMDGPNPVPNPGVTPGGIFSATPSTGIVINPVTGEIDLSQTTHGTYTIKYDLASIDCPVEHNEVVQINDTTLSYFAYPKDSVCQQADPVYPTFGSNPGVFQVIQGNGLAIDPNGVIYPQNSDTGFYVIEHIANEDCPVPYTETITILFEDSSNFSYQKVNYCQTEEFAHVDSSGMGFVTGEYTSTSGLAIDLHSGIIDLTNSTPGSYVITFTSTGGVFCPETQETSITIEEYDSLTRIAFPADSFCQGGGIIGATIIGDTSGNFSGFNIPWENPDSGLIDLDRIGFGEHIIYYRLNGVCSEEARDTIYVSPYDDATFAYPDFEFCQNESDPLPEVVATPGGTFLSPGNLAVDPVTGEIDLLGSAVGPHKVYYYTNDRCPNSDSVSVDVKAGPQPLAYAITPDSTICIGDSVTIESFSALNVDLYVNGVQVQAFRSNYKYVDSTYQNGDMISLIQTNFGNCLDTTEFSMTVHGIPEIEVLNSTGNLVSGEPAFVEMRSNVDASQFNYWTKIEGAVETEQEVGSISFYDAYETAQLNVDLFSTSDLYPGIITYYLEPEASGCQGEIDSVAFYINPAGIEIFIPEAFTPNGDGINDSWQVQCADGLDPTQFTLKVFNRSHGQVFSMNPIHAYWEGDGLPEGVYHWTLLDASGNVLDVGGLTLRRQ